MDRQALAALLAVAMGAWLPGASFRMARPVGFSHAAVVDFRLHGQPVQVNAAATQAAANRAQSRPRLSDGRLLRLPGRTRLLRAGARGFRSGPVSKIPLSLQSVGSSVTLAPDAVVLPSNPA